MTISPPAVLLGDQTPRIESVPPRISSAGQEVIELAASAGLLLDPWQQHVLDASLGERADGTWSAFEVGLIVSRQNGKGSILEARELAALFLFEDERLIIHSAHEFKTSKEAFLRIKHLIRSTPDLHARVERYAHSHGEEGIHLKNGKRLLFATRTGGGGRGFSGDLIILDEAYNLSDDHMAALMPTMSARYNPQIWYTSSAPDRDLAPCQALSGVRRRGIDGSSSRLAYFEWSIELCEDDCPPECADHDDPSTEAAVAKANPAYGIRLNSEVVAAERDALSSEAFLRERLGVGRYVVEGHGWNVIEEEAWAALRDGQSVPLDPVCFAADINPERTHGTISVAARREDGAMHWGVIEHRPGTEWMAARLKELKDKWSPCAIVLLATGGARSLISALDELGVEVVKASTADYAAACGSAYDAVIQKRVRWKDDSPLTAAWAVVEKRQRGEVFTWTRSDAAAGSISPLVGCTLAHWGHTTYAHVKQVEELEGSLMA